MFAPAPLNPEHREWLRKVGRDALAKLIAAAAVAAGTKLGETIAEAILGKGKDEGDGDTDEPGDTE